MPETTFYHGQEFSSFEEFDQARLKYQEENNCLFIVLRNDKCEGDEVLKYSSCSYACKQFGFPRKNPNVLGIRPKQSTYKTGCEAVIKLSRSKKLRKLIVNEVNLEHNHPCNKVTVKGYPQNRKLSKEEVEKTKDYIQAKVIPSIIRPLLREREEDSDKIILGRDISNIRTKQKLLERDGRNDEEMLQAKIDEIKMKDPGAHCKIQYDPDSKEVDFIFVQTSDMREALHKYPEVILMDVTYKINKNRMPVCVMEVMDGDGLGQEVCYAFLANEQKSTLYINKCSDPVIQIIINDLTDFASKIVCEQVFLSKKLGITALAKYPATSETCSCELFKTLRMPCQHIMLVRKNEGLPIYSKDLILKRWLKTYQFESVNLPSGSADEVVTVPKPRMPGEAVANILGPRQKFLKVTPVTQQINTLVSESGTRVFYQRFQVLLDIADSWSRGNEVMVVPLGADQHPDDDLAVQKENDEKGKKTRNTHNEKIVHQGEFELSKVVVRGRTTGRSQTVFNSSNRTPKKSAKTASQKPSKTGPQKSANITAKKSNKKAISGKSKVTHNCIVCGRDGASLDCEVCCKPVHAYACSKFKGDSNMSLICVVCQDKSDYDQDLKPVITQKQVPDMVVDLVSSDEEDSTDKVPFKLCTVKTKGRPKLKNSKTHKWNYSKLLDGYDDSENDRHVKGLEIQDEDVTTVDDSTWLVKSQSSNSYYRVKKSTSNNGLVCDCPDIVATCKHIVKMNDFLGKKLDKLDHVSNVRPQNSLAEFDEEDSERVVDNGLLQTVSIAAADEIDFSLSASPRKQYRCKNRKGQGCGGLLDRQICTGKSRPENTGKPYYGCLKNPGLTPNCKKFLFWAPKEEATRRSTLQETMPCLENENQVSQRVNELSSEWEDVDEDFESCLNDLTTLAEGNDLAALVEGNDLAALVEADDLIASVQGSNLAVLAQGNDIVLTADASVSRKPICKCGDPCGIRNTMDDRVYYTCWKNQCGFVEWVVPEPAEQNPWRHVTVRNKRDPLIIISSDSETETEGQEMGVNVKEEEPESFDSNEILSSTVNEREKSGTVTINVSKPNPLGLLGYVSDSDDSDTEVDVAPSPAKRPKRDRKVPTRLAYSYLMGSLTDSI